MQIILSVFVFVFTVSASAQMKGGRYFEDIAGTNWICSFNGTPDYIFSQKSFGLTLWEQPIASIKEDVTVFSFSDSSVTIEGLVNTGTVKSPGATATVTIATYKRNKEKRTISFVIPGQESTAYEFSYLSISTGSYISFTTLKVKKRNN